MDVILHSCFPSVGLKLLPNLTEIKHQELRYTLNTLNSVLKVFLGSLVIQ